MIGESPTNYKITRKGKVINGLFGQPNTTNYDQFSIQVSKNRSIVLSIINHKYYN